MPATDDAVALARTAADAADDRKATDLVLLDVADILALVDVFLLATASSDRQLKAVADRIEERLREDHDRKPLRREGTAASGWLLLDFGDVVCHLMSAEQRDYYALERLWADVPRRDLATGDLVAAPSPGDAREREGEADLTVDDVTRRTQLERWLEVPDDLAGSDPIGEAAGDAAGVAAGDAPDDEDGAPDDEDGAPDAADHRA